MCRSIICKLKIVLGGMMNVKATFKMIDNGEQTYQNAMDLFNVYRILKSQNIIDPTDKPYDSLLEELKSENSKHSQLAEKMLSMIFLGFEKTDNVLGCIKAQKSFLFACLKLPSRYKDFEGNDFNLYIEKAKILLEAIV